MRNKLFSIAIVLIFSINVAHSEFKVIEEKNLYKRDFRTDNMFFSTAAYDIDTVLDGDYLLCSYNWVNIAMSNYCFDAYYILSLVNRHTFDTINVKLDLDVLLDGVFLADKHWKNDTTLCLWFTSKHKMGVKVSQVRSVAYSEVVIKKTKNGATMYPLIINPEVGSGTNTRGNLYVSVFDTETEALASKFDVFFRDDIPFYVEDYNALYNLWLGMDYQRFAPTYHVTKLNYTEENRHGLKYDTLYTGTFDTSGYNVDANTFIIGKYYNEWIKPKTPNDVILTQYRWPDFYQPIRTKDGNFIVMAEVTCHAVDTIKDKEQEYIWDFHKLVTVGHHLFIFSKTGELLEDQFIRTLEPETEPEYRIVFNNFNFVDDGFYVFCEVQNRNYQYRQEVRKYNFKGELEKRISFEFLETTMNGRMGKPSIISKIIVQNDAIYMVGSQLRSENWITEGYFRAADLVKEVRKYSMDGKLLNRVVWDYDATPDATPHNPTLFNVINDAYVVDDTVYYFGHHSDVELGTNGFPGVNMVGKVWDSEVASKSHTDIHEANFATAIYPNPASSTARLTLDLKTSGNLTITLNNLLGQELLAIHNEFAASGEFSKTFSIETLPKGVYYLKITQNGSTKMEKLVKN